MAKVLMKGNEAVGKAAIEAGCRYFFGYPITPQSEVPEYLSSELPKVGGTFVQAESEVAAINMVYGAAAAGARVLTSSSSPGIALKQEGIGYISNAGLPAVIINMMGARAWVQFSPVRLTITWLLKAAQTVTTTT